ncbi:MAG: hypothetical protein NW201_12750 [Gemmatimonadales bacterium]|nr:hypothetical protein [Gemmatimonadales bacterium]
MPGLALALALVMQGPADTAFSSPELAALVRRAQVVNRQVPAGLRAYTVSAETETAFLVNLNQGQRSAVGGTRAGSTEIAGMVEQFASAVRWSRAAGATQKIVGYRSMSSALVPSVRTFIKQSWIIPSLYGDTIPLFVGEPDSAGRRQGRGLVHPFGADGEQLYTYSGGDTTLTLDLPGQKRAVIVLVKVEPRADLAGERRFVFSGDVLVDAVTAQVVRMKGRALGVGRRREQRGLVNRVLRAGLGLQSFAYFDLENRYEGGAYWLPGTQRLEFQASANVSDGRFTLRLNTEYGDYEIEDEPEDTLATAVARANLSPLLSEASADTLSSFGQWQAGLGDATQRKNTFDFDQYAPSWRKPDGRPVAALQARRIDEFFHFNRVEGPFTGVGGLLKLRDALPGAMVRGYAGYAWNNRTVRGEVQASLERGAWTWSGRAGRVVESTNTYGLFFDQGATIQSLWGRDNHDYVERWFAGASVTRGFGASQMSALRLEAGLARDVDVRETIRDAPIGGRDFLPNAPARDGTYLSTLAWYDWNRNVTGRFASDGVGGFLAWEGGFGDLAFHRFRGRLNLFKVLGPWMLISRLDGGVLASSAPPPQHLLRFGGLQGLPGYAFKQFAGDRAVLGRALVQYNLPLWKKPIVLGGFALPGVQPALAAGLYSGWAGASAQGQRLLDQLGWQTTNGVRTTLDLRVRFFGSAFSVGASRPLEAGGRWQFLFAFGDEL